MNDDNRALRRAGNPGGKKTSMLDVNGPASVLAAFL
jgi:hypothetical protein